MAFDRDNFVVLAQGGAIESYDSALTYHAKICVYTSADDDLATIIADTDYFVEIASGGDDPILTPNTIIHVIDSAGAVDQLVVKTAAAAAAGGATS